MRLLGGSNGRAIPDRANSRVSSVFSMGTNTMDLKAKIAKAKEVERIRTEIKNYEDVLETGRYTTFYKAKLLALKEQLDAL